MNTPETTLIPRATRAAPSLARAGLLWREWHTRGRAIRSGLVLGCLLFVGIVLRMGQFIPERSLCYDEAAVAVNIVHRSFAELWQPLDYFQGAPIGFLMIQKAMTELLGVSDRVLRLFPLLCSIASLFVFARVASLYVQPKAVVLAVALFALGRPLIYYSGEVKQYSSDVLIALLLLWVAAGVHRRLDEPTRSGLFLWGIVGALTVWFSHPSVFVLAGTGSCYLFWACRERRWRTVAAAMLTFVVWLLSFGVSYLCMLSDLSHEQYLLDFWKGSFMPLPPRSFADLDWFVQTFFILLNSPVGLVAKDISLAGIGALALFVGCRAMAWGRARELALLVSPLPFALLASGLHKYPFGDRLVLFLVPSVLLLMAAGAEQVRARTAKVFPFLGTAFLGLLFLAPVLASGGKLIQPGRGDEIKPVLGYLRDHRQPDDLIHIYTTSWPGYLFYAPEYHLPTEENIIRGIPGTSDWGKYMQDLDKLRGKRRVWLVMSQHQKVAQLFRAHLNRMGSKLDGHEEPGAAVYLYDFTKPGDP